MGIFSKTITEQPQPLTGKFVVIDGPDGSGKSTQMKLLLNTLEVSGYDPAVFDFPQYGQPSAAMAEKYLNGDYGKLGPQAASIFYAIDRFDASFKKRELMRQGKIIVSDRYVSSNAGHQGTKIDDYGERIKFYKWLDNLEFGIYNIPKPDLTIILHIPHEKTLELIDGRLQKGGRAKDIHEQDVEHLKRAEQVYLEIAELMPNTRLVECVENGQLLTPNEIHGKVWELVRRIALKGIEPNYEKTN